MIRQKWCIIQHTHYHALGEDFFLKVIDGLDDVDLAYRGTKKAKQSERRENYFLLVSKIKDANGNTVNVPVFINEHANENRTYIDVNKISTVFGRENFEDYIKRQIRDNNLVRIKNKSTKTSESNALIAEDYGEGASKHIVSQIDKNASNIESYSSKELSLEERVSGDA